jgi:hypothetical protein
VGPKERILIIVAYALLALVGAYAGLWGLRSHAESVQEATHVSRDLKHLYTPEELRRHLHWSLSMLSIAGLAPVGMLGVLLRKGPTYHHRGYYWLFLMGTYWTMKQWGGDSWPRIAGAAFLLLFGLVPCIQCLLRHSHLPDSPAPEQVASV